MLDIADALRQWTAEGREFAVATRAAPGGGRPATRSRTRPSWTAWPPKRSPVSRRPRRHAPKSCALSGR
ncbi:hypothetical protein DKT74_34755 [Streptomyces sp. ZEA17I]|nr:hypothetical protein DKT74_34755 [Streptomyces sp. ZEA17I]